MPAKVCIVILIKKQVMSALRNRFPFLDRTSQTQNIEKNIWTDFNFNTLLFLSFVVGEKGCKFSSLYRIDFQYLHWFVVSQSFEEGLSLGIVVRIMTLKLCEQARRQHEKED